MIEDEINLDKGWGVTKPHPDHPFILQDVRDELDNFRQQHKIKAIHECRLDIIEDLFNAANHLKYSGNIRACFRPMSDWINPVIVKDYLKRGKQDELLAHKESKMKYAQNLLNIPWWSVPPKNGTNIAKAVWVYMQIHENPDGANLETSDSSELRDRMEIKANSLLSISEDREMQELLLSGGVDPLFMNIKDKKLRDMLEIGAALNEFKDQLKVSSSTTLKPNANGRIVQRRNIIQYSDAIKASAVNHVHKEMFNYKLASKKLEVPIKMAPDTRKQLLYMLVDTSGSMGQEFKIAAVNFVLSNRLAAVMRGDAELFFSFYESKKFDEHFINTSEQAKAFFKKTCTHNYSMGGTDINGVLLETIKRCDELVRDRGYVRPDIMIVCDGQDTVDGSMDCHGYKIHTVHLDQYNHELAKISQRSKGMTVEITPQSLKKAGINHPIEKLANIK